MNGDIVCADDSNRARRPSRLALCLRVGSCLALF